MQTKTKALTALAVVLTALPALGWAQQGTPMRQQPPVVDFARADAAASGGISAEEWSAYVTARMTERRAEMQGQRADALIAAGDADGDGTLTRDELMSGFTALGQQRREARGDGQGQGQRGDRARGEMRGDMRGDDCDQGRGRDGGRHGGHDNRGGRGHGDGDRGHGRYGDDGDRGAMRSGGDRGRGMESGDRALRAFDRIDQNDDGQIDEAELTAMQSRMQRMMPRQDN